MLDAIEADILNLETTASLPSRLRRPRTQTRASFPSMPRRTTTTKDSLPSSPRRRDDADDAAGVDQKAHVALRGRHRRAARALRGADRRATASTPGRGAGIGRKSATTRLY